MERSILYTIESGFVNPFLRFSLISLSFFHFLYVLRKSCLYFFIEHCLFRLKLNKSRLFLTILLVLLPYSPKTAYPKERSLAMPYKKEYNEYSIVIN